MRLSKKFAAIAITASVALTASAAFAFFTSTGNGAGSATTGSASPWVISNQATTGGPLYPGAGIETVSYKVTNSGAGQQQLNSVIVSVVGSPACPATWFTVDNTGAPAAEDLAGGAFRSGSATITMQDSGPQDSCQGKTLVLSIDAS